MKGSLSDMSNLINETLKRHGIAKQVTAAMIVEEARNFVRSNYPKHTLQDFNVISYKEQVLHFQCAHISVRKFLKEKEYELISYLHTKFPSTEIKECYYRIVDTVYQENRL